MQFRSPPGLQSTLSFIQSISAPFICEQCCLVAIGCAIWGSGQRLFFNDHCNTAAACSLESARMGATHAPTMYLQYDFFSGEGICVCRDCLGKRKIPAVDAGGDKQSSYRAARPISPTIPVHGGDEVGLNLQYFTSTAVRSLPRFPNRTTSGGGHTCIRPKCSRSPLKPSSLP